ncbi:MAG: beta-ketoacyl synthase chain length factor [Breznakibacter sp.]|nr:beta-ketoacyl synthase chain length factor [Breznakibacter sp.]
MKRCYLNGIGSVSAQGDIDNVFSGEVIVNNGTNFLEVRKPVYKDYISPIAMRRMAAGVKNSVVASSVALKEANREMVDAIITGTGTGCIEDSEKFLNLVVDNNEEYLTPLSFIQSTHNAVSSHIALGLKCRAYNLTYANSAISFETALLDAKMLIEEDEASVVLIGGVDEMTEQTISFFELAGIIKDRKNIGDSLLNSTSKGVVYGEGATFFVVEDELSPSTYAELVDITFENSIKISELESKMVEFLSLNALTVEQIDAVVLGFNGDVETDLFYRNLTGGLFKDIPQLYYKHLCGEFNTSSAFGIALGANLLKRQQIPSVLSVNNLSRKCYKRVLLYNQYKGADHSFVLLASV